MKMLLIDYLGKYKNIISCHHEEPAEGGRRNDPIQRRIGSPRPPTLRFVGLAMTAGLLYSFFPGLHCQAKDIDIGLHDSLNRVYISANKDFEIVEDKGSLNPTSKLTLIQKKANDIVLLRSAPETSNLLVIASAPDLLSASSRLKITCKEESKIDPCVLQVKTYQTDPNKYDKFRGAIIIEPRKKDFTVINRLDIEDYLRSVVPSEMLPSWPLEALKAQAIAARTYTLAKMGRRKNLGYDLKPTIEDQMYQGFNSENNQTNKAVEATQGKFMLDHLGNYVDAYYSAHAGEFSSMPENTWQISPKHYLVAVKEPNNDKNTWEFKLTKIELENKLKDLNFKSISGITITERSPEGRVKSIIISGLKQSSILKHQTLTGEEFRHQLGLKSTFFEISTPLNSTITIQGKGFGHGVGMSQYGAKALGEKGKSYEEILGYFYKKAKLAELKD